MGYYSDAGLALTQTGISIFNDKLSRTDLSTREEVQNLLAHANSHFTDPDTHAEVWMWKDIKWYPFDPVYFPEIDFMERFLSDLDEEEFRFIRIGEDYDDTEVRGFYTENPFDLELSRSMSLCPAQARIPV